MNGLRELYGPISREQLIDFFAEARRTNRTCMRGHTVDPVNSSVEWSRHGNLTPRCKVCRRNRDHNRKRKKYARTYRGVRQRLEDAAKEICLGEEIGSVIDKYIPGIVSGRLRKSRSTNNPPTDAEVEEAWNVAVTQLWEAVDRMAKDDHKKPWNYLRVKPEAEAAWDRFNKALERAYSDPDAPQPNCIDRAAEFCDYDEDSVPSAEEAYDMCAGCPLLISCGQWAEDERPAWGVYAGSVYVHGEEVHD